jgi:AcrR family transcriptional regulator
VAAPASAGASKRAAGTRKAGRAAASAGLKKPYHHGDLRSALVEAAARLAAEVGPAAVTLREVARRAGVSQAAPYHHFADKSALLAAVAEAGFRLFDAHQAAALAAAPDDPLARLAELGVSYLRFALTETHYFHVMFRPPLFDGRRYPELDEVGTRSFERLVETTRAARAVFGIEDEDPRAAAFVMWSLPHGLAGLFLDSAAGSGMSPALMESLVRAASASLAAMRLLPRTATQVR